MGQRILLEDVDNRSNTFSQGEAINIPQKFTFRCTQRCKGLSLRFPSHQSTTPQAHDALMTLSSSWCKRRVCQHLQPGHRALPAIGVHLLGTGLIGERIVKGVHEVPHHMMSQLEHFLWTFCHPGTQVGDRKAQVRPCTCR